MKDKQYAFMLISISVITALAGIIIFMIYLNGLYNEIHAVATHCSEKEFDSYWTHDFCDTWHGCAFENDSFVPYKDFRGEK